MPTLDWLNRDAACRITAQVPTRVLHPHQAMPAGVGETGPAGDGKLLILGDNLAALKALLSFYRGRVKCTSRSLSDLGNVDCNLAAAWDA